MPTISLLEASNPGARLFVVENPGRDAEQIGGIYLIKGEPEDSANHGIEVVGDRIVPYLVEGLGLEEAKDLIRENVTAELLVISALNGTQMQRHRQRQAS